jgi:hypothetical protein
MVHPDNFLVAHITTTRTTRYSPVSATLGKSPSIPTDQPFALLMRQIRRSTAQAEDRRRFITSTDVSRHYEYSEEGPSDVRRIGEPRKSPALPLALPAQLVSFSRNGYSASASLGAGLQYPAASSQQTTVLIDLTTAINTFSGHARSSVD